MANDIVQGFKASAVAAGIKKDGGLDMASTLWQMTLFKGLRPRQ
jgi:hypothetical protein